MTTEATIDGTIAGTMPAHAPIIRHAGRVLAIAGGLGIVGQLLFFDVGLGINFPGCDLAAARRRMAPAPEPSAARRFATS